MVECDATALELIRAETVGDNVSVAELTHRLSKGDEAAYRIFFALYYDRLFRYLHTVLQGDEQRVRDALQATLLRVVKHVRRFPDETVFWSWLAVLARSSAFDDLRKRRRYGFFLERFARESEIRSSIPNCASPEDAKSLEIALDRALELLSPDERRVIDLKYRHGRTVHEIADELGESEKAIESRLGRIRRRLKETVLRLLNHGHSR